MSNSSRRHVFTSECVSEGHPDKVADQISDAILDACLKRDPNAHVACETIVAPDVVINVGEISCQKFAEINTKEIASRVIKRIGYNDPFEHFSYDSFRYESYLHKQSPDIARGVSKKVASQQGAGDQGMMFGYATNETTSLLPAGVLYSRELMNTLTLLRHSRQLPWLRPDAKCQFTVAYIDGRPVEIETVVISHQTTEQGANAKCYAKLEQVAREFLKPSGLVSKRTRFLINPTGQFIVGGPAADSGLTGRKIIVDTYGGFASHGGGAFSGKDASKVDRSATYYARYAAKNIVAAGLAARCEIQVAYVIGLDRPVSYFVNTFGTAMPGLTDSFLEDFLASGKMFDFRPYAIAKELGLLSPKGWSYEQTAAKGHFGNHCYPWEKTNKMLTLKKLFKVK